MTLYHYIDGKQQGVYSVEPGTSIETVFTESSSWPGTRLLLILCQGRS